MKRRFISVAIVVLSCSVVHAEVTEQRSAEERGEVCFSAKSDPTVTRMLTPQTYTMPGGQIVHETRETIDEIHRLMWANKDTIDPRLVYYRMFGESDAKPFQPNLAGSGAYGLFQFLGRFYKQPSHKNRILALYKKYPNKSPRLIQLEYYYDVYIATLKENTDKGRGGCHPARWNKLSAVQKIAYLGWGNCGKGAVKAEKNLCKHNAGYKPDACLVGGALVAGATVPPLCDQP